MPYLRVRAQNLRGLVLELLSNRGMQWRGPPVLWWRGQELIAVRVILQVGGGKAA